MTLYNPRFTETNPEDKITTPENLVFSGGGIKGIAYTGVVEALEILNLFKDIKGFAGASAGAITAALLTIGMTGKELAFQMSAVDFSTFLQKSNVNIESLAENPSELLSLRVGPAVIYDEVSHLGLCDGTVFVQWLTSMFKLKGFDETTTFTDLYQKTGKELYIALCYANCSKTVIASHKSKETASMPVVTAVRGSMSIPMIFQPLTWNNNVYIDGGTMYNYPIEVFDETSDRDKTLGFILSSQDSVLSPPRREDTGIFSHLGCVYEALMNVSYEYCFRMGNQHRTIFIDPAGINTLDFKLSEDEKTILKTNGYHGTLDYFL